MEQLPAEESVHCPLDGVNVPELLDEVKMTIPVGDEPPVTVAAQVVDEPIPTVEGRQLTDVVVR